MTDLAKERRTTNRIFGRSACGLLTSKSNPIFGLPFYLLRHPKQLHKHLDLCAQHVRNDRREDEVDRAQGVTVGRPHIIAKCRYENYRRMRNLLTAANQSGRLEPVHTRHVYVQQYDSEYGTKHVFQRFFARSRGDDVLSKICQYRLIDQQLVGLVIHDQNVDLPVIVRDRAAITLVRCNVSHRAASGWRYIVHQGWIHTRRTANNFSVSTGLDK